MERSDSHAPLIVIATTLEMAISENSDPVHHCPETINQSVLVHLCCVLHVQEKTCVKFAKYGKDNGCRRNKMSR